MTEAVHSNAGDDDQPYPPGPLDRHVGLLKGAVYTMGVMIIVGTIVLIVGIFWKASQPPAGSAGAVGPAGTFDALDIAVPPGAAVRSVDIDGDRMAVTLEAAQDEIVIVDLRRGEIVGRIRLTPEGPAAGAATSPVTASP